MKLRLLVLGCFLFSLTSCFDIIETFNIKEDGSGNYEVKTDMSNALSMLAMMGGGKESEKMPEKFDTMFSFKGIADTVSVLTAEEKAAIDKITARIHIDKDKGEMYMMMDMPFRDARGYNLVQEAFQKINDTDNNPVDGMFKGLFGGGSNPMAAGGDEQITKKGGGTPGIMPSNVVTLLSANKITRTVKPVENTETPKTPEDMPEELKEMFKMNYTTIVNLPRPVKSFKGAGKVSDDKKQVKSTKKIDLTAGFTAADFDFTIDY